MVNPKFSVGEEVILWPKDYAEYRGMEVVVLSRSYGKFTNTSGIKEGSYNWAYHIDPNPSPKAGHPLYVGWNEGSLRPKPKGNGLTMTEFMKTLKTDKVVV